MNDRFKFRVWNPDVESYDDDPQYNVDIKIDQENGLVLTPFHNNIIEFCTGFSDKNGNLIYEGDIIKYCVNWRNYVLTYTRIVAWDNDMRGFVALNSKTQVKPLQKRKFPDPNTHIIEIVGNIHTGIKGE